MHVTDLAALSPGASCPADTARYDRQVRALGRAGQERLSALTVAVAGVGGAGSLVVQSLAHLGVGGLVLVDPDIIEATNLNRVIGANALDAVHRRPKVNVAARLVRRINPSVRVTRRQGSVLDPAVWTDLRSVDVIVGAVDSDAARWALNILAIQYARPYLDIGVEVVVAGDRLEVGGHVATVYPGGPCLRCLQGYNSARAAEELQPELMEAKRASGYLRGVDDEPSPSVIFLNEAVVALAVGELVNWVAPWKPAVAYLLLDLAGSRLTPIDALPDRDCPFCGPEGVRGLGDAGGSPISRPITITMSTPPASPPATLRPRRRRAVTPPRG